MVLDDRRVVVGGVCWWEVELRDENESDMCLEFVIMRSGKKRNIYTHIYLLIVVSSPRRQGSSHIALVMILMNRRVFLPVRL